MTDKSNVITVTQENLTWINENVPGKSKKERLENMLLFYKVHGGPRKTDTSLAAAKSPGGCPA